MVTKYWCGDASQPPGTCHYNNPPNAWRYHHWLKDDLFSNRAQLQNFKSPNLTADIFLFHYHLWAKGEMSWNPLLEDASSTAIAECTSQDCTPLGTGWTMKWGSRAHSSTARMPKQAPSVAVSECSVVENVPCFTNHPLLVCSFYRAQFAQITLWSHYVRYGPSLRISPSHLPFVCLHMNSCYNTTQFQAHKLTCTFYKITK